MKIITLVETIEHRFILGAGEAVEKLNDVAGRAYEVCKAEIPETDLTGAVWKMPKDAKVSVPDKCADKIVALGYAVEG